MVYRLGRRVRVWQWQYFQKGILLASIAALAVIGSTLGVGSHLGLDVLTEDGQPQDLSSQARSFPMSPNSKPNSGQSSKGSVALASTIPQNSDCNGGPPPPANMASAVSPVLQKLAQYEAVCRSAIINRGMYFTNMPVTTQQAIGQATDVAATLKEFASFGIPPLVIMEPTSDTGRIDLHAFAAGQYDSFIDTLFQTLKAQGVTDQMMGMWVPFPEPNIPEWGTLSSADFVANVTRTVQLQKKYFPTSQASIMLDSETYSNQSWSSGTYASLLPYVKNFPKGLIDSFGFQGFPWAPPAGSTDSASYSAADFLNPKQAQEAAKQLGVTQIWLNSGTFARSYTLQPTQTVTLSAAQRATILADILTQAKKLKASGYSLSINLFAEDKSKVSEAIDWSYWQTSTINTSPSTPVFKTFAHDVKAAGIQLWVYDSN